jgi:hypothetical protein
LKFPNSLPILPYQRKIDPKTRKEAFPKFIESLREIKGYKQIYVAYKASILIDESGNLNLDEEVRLSLVYLAKKLTFLLAFWLISRYSDIPKLAYFRPPLQLTPTNSVSLLF